MIKAERHVAAVEVPHFRGAYARRPDCDARAALVELLEVDQLFQRPAQRIDRIIASRVRSEPVVRAQERHRVRAEEGRNARSDRAPIAGRCCEPIGETLWDELVVLYTRPELAQFLEALAGLASGDERRVDRSDRRADHPLRGDSGLVQRLVYADLIGAERASALEDENGLAERGHFLGERSHAHFLSNACSSCGLGGAGAISPVMRRALRW